MTDLVPLAEDVLLYRGGATLLAMLAAFCAVISLRLPFRALIRKQEEDFHGALVELFLFDVTPRQLTYVMFGGAFVAGTILALLATHAEAGALGVFITFVVGTVLGYWVPRLVIFLMQRRRRDKLNEQLIDGLVTLANGMRAGLNLVQSMQLIEDNTEPPISQEFGLMLREFEHGTSVDEVMRRASARLKLHHYQLLFAAKIIRLEEKVRALTAENKTSAIMMGLMPLVIAGVYYMIEPTWVQALFEDQWGLLLLAIAVFLNIVGFLWIRKIVTFEI